MTTSFQPEYDYLRPPASARLIIHEDSYKLKKTPARRIRRIFYKTPYEELEEQKITEFEEMIKRENVQVPNWWNRQECLRWCYSKRLELPQSMTLFKNHLTWAQDPKFHKLSAVGLLALKKGAVYQLGRDSKMRPIIVVDVPKIIEFKIEVDDFLNAMVQILELVRTKMMLPGHVENNIVIIETGGMSLFNIPIGHLKGIINTASNNYPESLAKMYILNPSFILRTSWSLIKAVIEPETVDKIAFLKSDDFDQLQEMIPVDQLEERFGGILPNQTEFWPPRLTFPADQQIVWNNCQFEVGRWDPNNYKARKNKKIPQGVNISQCASVHHKDDAMSLVKSHSEFSEEGKDSHNHSALMKESFKDCLNSSQFPKDAGVLEEHGVDASIYYSAKNLPGVEPSVIIVGKQEDEEEDIPELSPGYEGWNKGSGMIIPAAALIKMNRRQISLEAPDHQNGFCGCNRPDERPVKEEPEPEKVESPKASKEECVLI